jgi:hypothetical protein
MARRPLPILMVLVLSACASEPPTAPPPSAQTSATDPALIAEVKAEREAAQKVYALCLDRTAKRLDDHKSDPATIARGMLSACAAESDEVVKVYSRYLEDGLQGREKVAKSLREASLDSAIQLVLRNRKAAQSR